MIAKRRAAAAAAALQVYHVSPPANLKHS